MEFEATRYLNKNILKSNFKLLQVSEVRQVSVIQKLQMNFKARKYDTVR